MKFVPGNRELRRTLERMGMSFETLEGVQEVIIKTNDGEIIIKQPDVNYFILNNVKIYQIVARLGEERKSVPHVSANEISESDIELVALKAGVAKEIAREALLKSNGDLAKAILLLKGYNVK